MEMGSDASTERRADDNNNHDAPHQHHGHKPPNGVSRPVLSAIARQGDELRALRERLRNTDEQNARLRRTVRRLRTLRATPARQHTAPQQGGDDEAPAVSAKRRRRSAKGRREVTPLLGGDADNADTSTGRRLRPRRSHQPAQDDAAASTSASPAACDRPGPSSAASTAGSSDVVELPTWRVTRLPLPVGRGRGRRTEETDCESYARRHAKHEKHERLIVRQDVIRQRERAMRERLLNSKRPSIYARANGDSGGNEDDGGEAAPGAGDIEQIMIVNRIPACCKQYDLGPGELSL